MIKTARQQPASAIQASANVRFFDGLANRAIIRHATNFARRVAAAGGSTDEVVEALTSEVDRFGEARKVLYSKVHDTLWAPVRARWVDEEPHSDGVRQSADPHLFDPIMSDA